MSPASFVQRLQLDPLTGWFSCAVDVAGALATQGVVVAPHDVSAAIVRAARDLASGPPWAAAGGELLVHRVHGESSGAGWLVGVVGQARAQAYADLASGAAFPWLRLSAASGALSLDGVLLLPTGARVISSRPSP
jgi:hypothetical protein